MLASKIAIIILCFVSILLLLCVVQEANKVEHYKKEAERERRSYNDIVRAIKEVVSEWTK